MFVFSVHCSDGGVYISSHLVKLLVGETIMSNMIATISNSLESNSDSANCEELYSWEDLKVMSTTPSICGGELDSHPQLKTDVEYAENIIKRINPSELQDLLSEDIFGTTPSAEYITLKTNTKTRKMLLALCEPNLQKERANRSRSGNPDSFSFRHKIKTQFVESRKGALLFYHNALVRWIKHNERVSNSTDGDCLLGLILKEGGASYNFFDRMILTIGYLWKHLTNDQSEMRSSGDAISQQPSTLHSNEGIETPQLYRYSLEDAREDIDDIRGDIKDIHHTRNTDKLQLTSMIEELRVCIAEMNPRSDAARKNPRLMRDENRVQDSGHFIESDNICDITSAHVLAILHENHPRPMHALQIRDIWFKIHGVAKNEAPSELQSATVYNRILTQLLNERRVLKDVSMGKPLWSLAAESINKYIAAV